MIVTLLTDFGSQDAYVAAMKGAILTRHPGITLIDISHEVPAQDIETAAYHLLTCHGDFPPGTVHTVVVDPGVGSSRREIVARVGGHFFVGPDNGVFDWIVSAGRGEVRSIHSDRLRRPSASSTFHGRDIFAPAAAELAAGFPFEEVGPPIADWVALPSLAPERSGEGLTGRILHIDHFGNCITNFRREHLEGLADELELLVGDQRVTEWAEYFQQSAGEEAFLYWGSSGFLEAGVNGASAASLLGAEPRAPVVLSPGRGGG